MNKKSLGADFLLLLTALIWGLGFVAQRSGMEVVGPFAFNGIRFLLGSFSLVIFILVKKNYKLPASGSCKHIIITGCCLFIAVSLQQLGIIFTTAGNAGFITGLYVVLTPVIGIFLKKKTRVCTWIGTLFTLIGLYFICIKGTVDVDLNGTLNPGDILVAAGSVFWAFHVLLIDRFVQKTDPIIFSSGQFAVCGILSLASAFLFEPLLKSFLFRIISHPAGDIYFSQSLLNWLPLSQLLNGLAGGFISVKTVSGALIPILYGGFASVGIAYTLQVAAQRFAPPAHATIIMCLEGSFAAIGGIIILKEPVSFFIIIGFALMLTGMLTSQLGLNRETN